MTAPKQHNELGWVMGPGSTCRICGKDYLHTHTHQEVVSAVTHPAPASASEPEQGEPAPPHSLPDYDECALRVHNSDFIAKRVAEGGYGAEPDSMLATQLHRFIYEYDDADPYRSAWFMHRLELLVNELQSERASSPASGASTEVQAPIPQASGAVHEHYFGALTMAGYKCLCGAIKRGNQIIEAAPPASASTASRVEGEQ